MLPGSPSNLLDATAVSVFISLTGASRFDSVGGGALCLMAGPELQELDPNGEWEGAAFPDGAALDAGAAARLGGGPGEVRGAAGDALRTGVPAATPLSSSSSGRSRCACTSFKSPSSR